MSKTDEKIDDSTADLAEKVAPFIVKTCVVAAVATACTIFATDWIIGSVEDSLARSVRNVQQISIGGRKFWTRLEEELDRAAAPSSDLPAERKQKIVNDVRVIAARWRPLIDALQEGKQSPTATTSEAGK